MLIKNDMMIRKDIIIELEYTKKENEKFIKKKQ